MYRLFRKANAFNRFNHGVALLNACRTKVRTNDLQSEQLPVLVRYATGLEITVKCHATEGKSWPIPFKNGLSVRFGSDDSGTPCRVVYAGNCERKLPAT